MSGVYKFYFKSFLPLFVINMQFIWLFKVVFKSEAAGLHFCLLLKNRIF